MGRGARVFRAEQAAKQRSGMVSVGNIDTSEIRGMRLYNAQGKSVDAISSLAKAVGFNVRFIANPADADGRFTGKNGSRDKATRTITIDVNAGRVSTGDANYTIMQTAGHELTHFIKDFADTALWDDYQSFVFGHLSEAMDKGTLDAKVEQYIERWAQAGKTIDRDGAIDFAEYAFAGDLGDDSDVKFSLRDYSPEQKANWAGSNSIVLYSDQQQAMRFVEEARENKGMNKNCTLA